MPSKRRQSAACGGRAGGRSGRTARRGRASTACGSSRAGPKTLADVQELAQDKSVAAIETLAAIHADAEQPAAARISAANSILDRAFGRPQAASQEGEGPIVANITVTFVKPPLV
jgi:hypothetical protein